MNVDRREVNNRAAGGHRSRDGLTEQHCSKHVDIKDAPVGCDVGSRQ
jgi:hypothetical protein